MAWQERLRSCLGALLGIAFTGALTHFLLGSSGNIPMLVAPMGASAVLLFAVPASPLAQPWSIMGGKLVSAISDSMGYIKGIVRTGFDVPEGTVFGPPPSAGAPAG